MTQEIIDRTVEFVKSTLDGAEGGHDWWHIYRVWNLSKTIALKENANLFIVELGALLHDIADSKFNGGDDKEGPELAGKFLNSINVEDKVIHHVQEIIKNISFHKSWENESFSSKELEIIQDADRLDALGAIGIARTFNYGGYKNRELYNPDIPPVRYETVEEYKNNTSPTINHFYEKLLLLKDLMNTETGKSMAAERHKFMESFLDQFYKEWKGKV